MPTHNGIKMTIVSQWELKLHPEFPHPESTQFTNRSLNNRHSFTIAESRALNASPDSKADRLLGRQSSVSVYIPSLAGARFWLRYHVLDASSEPTTPWYYFKLFMNGRHITSWGTHTKKKPHGQVMRALFDPSERWNYKSDGIVYKSNNSEMRPFFFSNKINGKLGAADDGGLIEVQVFRAKGRIRKIPDPVEFKPQDQYGIVMPSAGILDKPQDAKFYDWHLKDPKDRPFTSFKFHYRSWDSLESLQLIPADYPRCLLPPSPSILELNGLTMDWYTNLLQEETEAQKKAPHEAQIHNVKVTSPRKRNSTASDGSPTRTTRGPDRSLEPFAKASAKRAAFLNSPITSSPISPDTTETQVPITKFSTAAIERQPMMKKHGAQDVVERPLPEIPTRGASLKHSRNTSTASGAPSITPSLLPYLDRDTVSPPPIIGVAALFPIGRVIDEALEDDQGENTPPQGEEDEGHLPNEDVFEDSDLKPRPLSTTKRQGMSSPPLGFFSLPNVTLRSKKSPYKKLPKILSSADVNSYAHGTSSVGKDEDELETLENTTTLSLSESEWMCRTPSPVMNDPDRIRIENLWSPGQSAEKRKSATKEGGSLRKRAIDWYDTMRNSAESESPSKSGFGDGKIKGGNWI